MARWGVARAAPATTPSLRHLPALFSPQAARGTVRAAMQPPIEPKLRAQIDAQARGRIARLILY